MAIALIIMFICIFKRNREKVDEFADEIMRSVNEKVLNIVLEILTIGGIVGVFLSSKISISIPWYSALLIVAGFAYCSIYIEFIIMLKRQTSDYEEDDDDDDDYEVFP